MTELVPVPRIVSLVPSVTETLLAWGITPVAVTRFCEQPSLPTVGGTKDPEIAAIVDLHPDLVVANTEENRLEDAEMLTAAGLDVLALEIDGLQDLVPAMTRLAEACGLDAPPDLAALASVTAGEAATPTRRVFVPIWRRPWMTLGPRCYATSLLTRLGIEVVVPRPANGNTVDRYPTTTLDDVASLHPDVVLAPSEPYPFAPRHVPELATVAPVVLVDGKDLFWWGARTPEALRRLANQVVEPARSA